MKKNKIDKDLLKRYLENSCNEEERILVNRWLQEETFENLPTPNFFNNERESIKESIFTNVVTNERTKSKKLHIPTYIKCAATIVGFILLLPFLFTKESTNETLLASNIKLEQRVIHIDEPTYFTAEHNSEIKFIFTSKNDGTFEKELLCEKGNTYLAVKVSYQTQEELLIINQKDFDSLPPFLGDHISTLLNS